MSLLQKIFLSEDFWSSFVQISRYIDKKVRFVAFSCQGRCARDILRAGENEKNTHATRADTRIRRSRCGILSVLSQAADGCGSG
ncbi:hypothetical protein DLR74_02440 [Vibrio paracholerae]|nr:hypothetical protein DLR74_02440 [Vibrio paracholerae]